MHLLSAAVTVGAFETSLSIIEQAQSRGEVLQMTGLIDVIRDSVSVLNAVGVTEDQAVKVVDMAGEILRSRKLVWLNDLPDVYSLPPGEGGPVVSLAYRVAVSPSEASEMTWQLLSKRIDSDLDSNGFQVSFTVVDLPSEFSSLRLG